MAPEHPIAPTASAPALRHNAALDGIRGLAILFVLGHHLLSIDKTNASAVYVVARGVQACLFSGVDIFFALSGFLITRILITTLDDPHYFRSFYARRSLRIFPLYYGVVLLFLALTPVLHIHWGGQQWRLLTYSNRLFESRRVTDWNFYFGHGINLVNLWSLHVEEQFYIVWPLFVYLIRAPRRLLAFAAGTSALGLGLRIWMYTHGFSTPYIHSALVSRMDGLLIGGCLAISLFTRYHELFLRLATPVFLSFLALFVADYTFQQLPGTRNIPYFYPVQFTLLAVASTAMIAMCLKPRSRAARVFRNPVLRFFGKYSYGIYVYHSILSSFGYQAVKDYLMDHVHPTIAANLLNTAIEVGITIVLSMLSFHYFESPILKLKRYFKPQVPTTAPEPATATA